MRAFFVLASFIILANSASAVIYDRECRSVTMVMDFDVRNYAGNWYEVQRYETSPQWNGDCSTFDYELDYSVADPDELAVTHRFSFRNNGTVVRRTGSLSHRMDHLSRHDHGHGVGHLFLTFDDAPHTIINYCLVASDYTNYAVVWSCTDLGDGRSNEDAWVLSKTSTLNPDYQAAVQAAIDLELDESIMIGTYQGANCQVIVDPFKL